MIKIFVSKIIHKTELIKILLFSKFLGSHYMINSLRQCYGLNIGLLLNKKGANIGCNNNFKGDLNIDNYQTSNVKIAFENLVIGNNCYIGKSVNLDLAGKIIFKDDVVLSTGVTILTHEDVGKRLLSKYYVRKSKMVIIEDGAWIGANVTILQGVRVGECSVVAAGSTVIRDVPSYSVVAGIPAKFKKRLTLRVKANFSDETNI